MKKDDTARQALMEYVLHLVNKVYDGDVAEFRVMRNRKGVSVLPTKRRFFSGGRDINP